MDPAALDLLANIDRTTTAILRAVLEASSRLNSLPEPSSASENAEYLSIGEAALLTGLSYSMIRRAILAHELSASKVGSVWRIRRTDLDGWMEKAKGGTRLVPPHSQLKDLIERHLLGL